MAGPKSTPGDRATRITGGAIEAAVTVDDASTAAAVRADADGEK